METTPAAANAEPLEKPEFYLALSRPRWVYVMMGAIVAMFIVMIIYGQVVYGTWNGPETIEVLIDLGAKVNLLIYQGQTWRLFTAMFLHIGVLHLLFNLYALYALGPMVEGYFGHWRFLAIYLLGGLFGSLASYAFSPAISAGASGAIFALAGAITVYFLRYHENFGAAWAFDPAEHGGHYRHQPGLRLCRPGYRQLGPYRGADRRRGGGVGPHAPLFRPGDCADGPPAVGKRPAHRHGSALGCLIVVVYYIGLQFANQITPLPF